MRAPLHKLPLSALLAALALLVPLTLASPSDAPRHAAGPAGALSQAAPGPFWLGVAERASLAVVPLPGPHAARPPASGASAASPGRALDERVRTAWLQRRDTARVEVPLRRVSPPAEVWPMLEAAGLVVPRGTARTTASGSQVRRARLHKQGLPVFDRPLLFEERDGRLVGRHGAFDLAPFDLRAPQISADEAVERAIAHVQATALRAPPRAERGWRSLPGETVPVVRVSVAGRRPFGSFEVDVDARDGRILGSVDRVRTLDGQGRVHDPNIVDDPAGSVVPLFDLDGSGALSGDFARVFDVVGAEAFSPGLDFLFPPGDARFVQTSVYRGLTDAGRLAVAGGFPAFPQPLLAFTNLRDPSDGVSEFNNAFYDPFFQVFGFGNGDGALTANLGTDLDVAAHEMAHHVFQQLVDPELVAFGSTLAALDEGVADTWAALLSDDPEIGESTLPGNPFLRNVDNTRSFLDPFEPDPHVEGEIVSGTCWEIAQLIGTAAFGPVLIDALVRLPSDASPVDFREAVLAANLAVRGGADQAAIQAVFTNRAFEETEPDPDFEGFLEPGIPQARFLPDSPPFPADSNIDIYIFEEFPGSERVRFETTGTGDVDLFVAALDPSVVPTEFSGSVGSDEVIELLPGSNLSVDAADDWFVAVQDFPDGAGSSYEITATIALRPADLVLDGPALAGSIDGIGQVDFYLFETTQPDQVVRAQVTASASLDPVLVVFDPFTVQVFDGDDDSGPGTDAFLEGVQLPVAGPYAIAVLAFSGEVDNGSALGGYQVQVSTCDNGVGPDSDGDGLVDGCDPDDDEDDFRDAQDSAPLDPSLCADQDEDGCDDCSSGSFDPFDDGPDADGDALCDAGDSDDDNDGCLDLDDPAPLLASLDGDFDFLGDDCDNCRDVANPDQADVDAGFDDDTSLPGIQHYGDVCDADLDDDGAVGPSDFFSRFRPCLGADLATRPACLEADLNGDGSVGPADFFSGLRPAFGTQPGPGVTE